MLMLDEFSLTKIVVWHGSTVFKQEIMQSIHYGTAFCFKETDD